MRNVGEQVYIVESGGFYENRYQRAVVTAVSPTGIATVKYSADSDYAMKFKANDRERGASSYSGRWLDDKPFNERIKELLIKEYCQKATVALLAVRVDVERNADLETLQQAVKMLQDLMEVARSAVMEVQLEEFLK